MESGLVTLAAVLLCIAIHSVLPSFSEGAVTCRDNSNNPVDWFIVYKLPKNNKSSSKTVRLGLGQAYMDVNNLKWTLSQVSINDSTRSHAVYNTLSQIYNAANSEKTEIAYLMHNDEKPDGNDSDKYGHTKGDVAFDSAGGFWLVHSVPKFPPVASESYSYPKSGTSYGQSFLCVSYDYKTFNFIGNQLLFNYPQIYDSYIPSSFQGVDNIVQVISGNHTTKMPYNNSLDLTSSAGVKFTSFAKTKSFGKDLYHDLVAPYYSSNLYVESWLNGHGAMSSNCSSPCKVWNVENLSIVGESFTVHRDHSKWAVTTAANQGDRSNRLLFRSHRHAASLTVTCIGDINRENGQLLRGGGTVCFSLTSVWNAYSKIIQSHSDCS